MEPLLEYACKRVIELEGLLVEVEITATSQLVIRDR